MEVAPASSVGADVLFPWIVDLHYDAVVVSAPFHSTSIPVALTRILRLNQKIMNSSGPDYTISDTHCTWKCARRMARTSSICDKGVKCFEHGSGGLARQCQRLHICACNCHGSDPLDNVPHATNFRLVWPGQDPLRGLTFYYINARLIWWLITLAGRIRVHPAHQWTSSRGAICTQTHITISVSLLIWA